ncbi:MAG: hypothetical protein EA400_14460 [Chromatiaceae bacterium]|nr:MAG: hypothetical protein EA400_14460 [Chromatiaceae bacterium]
MDVGAVLHCWQKFALQHPAGTPAELAGRWQLWVMRERAPAPARGPKADANRPRGSFLHRLPAAGEDLIADYEVLQNDQR